MSKSRFASSLQKEKPAPLGPAQRRQRKGFNERRQHVTKFSDGLNGCGKRRLPPCRDVASPAANKNSIFLSLWTRGTARCSQAKCLHTGLHVPSMSCIVGLAVVFIVTITTTQTSGYGRPRRPWAHARWQPLSFEQRTFTYTAQPPKTISRVRFFDVFRIAW